MNLPPAPIRFLMLIVAGWIALRAVSLVPWVDENASEIEIAVAADPSPARSRAAARSPFPSLVAPAMAATLPRSTAPLFPRGSWPEASLAGYRQASQFFSETAGPVPNVPLVRPAGGGSAPSVAATAPSLPATPSPLADWTFAVTGQPGGPSLPAVQPGPTRLAGSAWLLVRDQGAPGLALGGTLGGSQAGARLTYRLNADARRPLALSARAYAPLDRPEAAEIALGLDWRPIAAVPLNLLAERRQRVGREGRADFALTVYGGTEARLLRDRVRVEAYAQAGIVGVEEGDLFADGAILATLRVGPVDIGGGAWGGAQPGVSRLDVGPHVGIRLPFGPVTARAAAEWRFRVAGDAAPASGPALTLSVGF